MARIVDVTIPSLKSYVRFPKGSMIGAPGGSLVALDRYFEFANPEDSEFPAISDSIGLRV